MYNIKEEEGYDVLLECLELGTKHYEEVYGYRSDYTPRQYNYQFLKLCLENNLMHMVCARDGDGKMIGYFVDLVSPDMFSSEFYAKDMAIYVDEAYRSKGLFKEMLTVMENLLTENGVMIHNLEFQEGHNESMPLKYGYKKTASLYEKLLQEDS